MIQVCASGQRGVSLNLDAVFLAIFNQLFGIAERMAFDLIDSRYDAGYFFQLFEIMDPEITDSDRMCSAGTEDFFQFLPGTEIASRNWPVNQVKINVIQAKPIKTSLKSSVYISEPLCVVPDFCGDKKIFSGDAAFCNTDVYKRQV